MTIVHGYVGCNVDWLQQFLDNKHMKLIINRNMLVYFKIINNTIKNPDVLCVPIAFSVFPQSNRNIKNPMATKQIQD